MLLGAPLLHLSVSAREKPGRNEVHEASNRWPSCDSQSASNDENRVEDIEQVRNPAGASAALRTGLRSQVEGVSSQCLECGTCVRKCGFLQRYGTPKELAARCVAGDPKALEVAYACSLCGLCAAVCPVGLDPSALHLEMRRQMVDLGPGERRGHGALRRYERRGTSRRYSYYWLPEGCDTVFFPGCSLSGTRAGKVLNLLERLQAQVPNLGVVLDCCTKPSHDLGREAFFRAMFGELRQYLTAQGVRRVLVACPSCHKVFRGHGDGLAVSTVYEVLATEGVSPVGEGTRSLTLHDPCAARFEEGVHRAVRTLVAGMGIHVAEMEHAGTQTLCCGEGGAVGGVEPGLATGWAARRAAEAGARRVITYCAGCAERLARRVPTSHVVDLLFEPERALSGKARAARAPFTYWNRLRLKAYLKRLGGAAVTRERTFRVAQDGVPPGFRKAIRLAALAAVVIGLWGLATL